MGMQMNERVLAHQFDSGVMLQLIHGDLTQTEAEAIVNAANRQLAHGGGVAAALSRAGGPTIQEESDRWVAQHGPIDHDRPALTGAGELPASALIHVVGPRWGEGQEARKLATAIEAGLQLAEASGYSSLALPPVSTGIFGYPKEEAARVILGAIRSFAEAPESTKLRRIDLVIIDRETLEPFRVVFTHDLEPSDSR
jgi:O-acetyl-ADP-ribose deacetylase (regulator of RNase III)